ncbi:MAG TPA: MOSC domain-containing protein [Gaiellaceae bacterium]
MHAADEGKENDCQRSATYSQADRPSISSSSKAEPQIDRRRFRPNLFVNAAPDTDRFVEDDWLGGTLVVGETLALDEVQPTHWCVTSTLAQEELPRDLSILRTTAKEHKGCLGVYASVSSPELLRVGDPTVDSDHVASAAALGATMRR